MKTYHVIYREPNSKDITSKGINVNSDGIISAIILFASKFNFTPIIIAVHCLDELHSLMINPAPIPDIVDALEAANISSHRTESQERKTERLHW